MTMPAVIGRFVLGRRLGAGGFATVYLAEDPALQSPVAIKVLADNFSEDLDVRERFLREARLLRRVDADAVVRAHDVGEFDDGRPYLVMTYADRGTLSQRTAQPWPVEQALQVGAELADAVGVLHEAGVLHRDIKPSNVLFRSRPGGGERLLLGDLGLGKGLEHLSMLTMSSGTPGYMAPEQAVSGIPLSRACDTYGACAVVYRVLTGRPPREGFTGPGDARPVVPPSALRPGLPSAVDDVLLRGLDADPARRGQDARELAGALREAAAPVNAPTVALPSRPERRRLRRRGRWLAAGVALLLAVVAGVGALRWQRPVTVADDTGRLSVTVPRSWAGQTDRRSWDLGKVGGTGRQSSVVVSADLRAMGQRRPGARGVFVGLLGGGDPQQALAKFDWSGCTRGGDVPFDNGRLTGVLHQRTCSRLAVKEGALATADGRNLLVQVVEPVGGGEADAVLDSIAVGR